MHARPTAETTAEVRLTAGLARTFLTYLRSARENERGGVLLGQFEDWGVAVAGAVFPPQLARARDNCAFDVRDIDTVREAVTGLTDGEITRAEGAIVGWVHSHPAWGLFLSNTDKGTLRSWISLDDRTVAIVVDPFATEPEERIACWDKAGRGRLAVIRKPDQHGFTVRRASHLAEAISDHGGAGRWDVLVAGGIITVFPGIG